MKKPRERCVYLLLLWKSDVRDPLSATSRLSNEMSVCVYLAQQRPGGEARQGSKDKGPMQNKSNETKREMKRRRGSGLLRGKRINGMARVMGMKQDVRLFV